MNTRFLPRKSIACALTACLGLTALGGCGLGPNGSASPATPTTLSATRQSGASLAASCARELRKAGLAVSVKGPVVTIRGYDGSALTYDFTKTASTHTVECRTKKLRTNLGAGEAMATDTPAWPLVLIGGRMLVAAAEAWSWYRKTHTGSDYKRSELVQAILYAMLRDGTIGTPGGEVWVRLVPLVWEWVTGFEPITPDAKTILEAIKDDAAKVGAILAAAGIPEEPYYDPSKDPGYDPYNPGSDPAP